MPGCYVTFVSHKPPVTTTLGFIFPAFCVLGGVSHLDLSLSILSKCQHLCSIIDYGDLFAYLDVIFYQSKEG